MLDHPPTHKGIIPALTDPSEASKPRLCRNVQSFQDKIDELRNLKTDSIRCGAIPSHGQCRKETPIRDSEVLRNLDQLDISDSETRLKLIMLMLCDTHWAKAIYTLALFLDSESLCNLKLNTERVEDTITDYESSIAIDGKHLTSKSLHPPGNNKGRGTVYVAATNKHDVQDGIQTIKREEVHTSSSTSKSTEAFYKNAEESISEPPVVAGMGSFASLELGVAKLEILNRESLNCIAMTTNGWRCKNIIDPDQLLKARELLRSSVSTGSSVDFNILSSLVLCSNHQRTTLPEKYSEKWATFSAQRLSKDEAISRFNPDKWNVVQFFGNQESEKTARSKGSESPGLPSRVSTPRSRQTTPSNSFLRPESSQPPNCNFSARRHSFNMESTIPSISDRLRELNYSQSPSPAPLGTRLFNPKPPISLKPSVSVPELVEDPFNDNGPKHTGALSSGLSKNASCSVPIKSEVPPNSGLAIRTPQSSSGVPHVSGVFVEELDHPGERNTPQSAQCTKTRKISLFKGASPQSAPTMYPGAIDDKLTDEIRLPVSRKGYVYIFKSAHLKQVKIGRTTDVNRRINEIKIACQISDLETVDCSYVKYPERVEKLAHLELQNFRAAANCHHNKGTISGAVVHREWFDVPDEVAVKSVELWKAFVELAYGRHGTIKEHWAEMLENLPRPSSSETKSLRKGIAEKNTDEIALHHHLRHERYTKWFEDGQLWEENCGHR
ncbi:hypothetical protein BP5796_02193 [Coleophoma crateriformis]|uniref:Bacteriophage T5 Orf172 DNA-binding domain-containing protein n=1 Tax=Coleophoma crateriformis TaxID=565419 RepID=A0A3D8SZ32_9HELO|nr:hypothetical protein BP5796_02193 [Coleophoma crateriformis]